MVSINAAWLVGCALASAEILTIVSIIVWCLCLWFIPGLAERLELGSLAIGLLLPIPATLIGGAMGLIWALLHPVPVPGAGNLFLPLGVLPAFGAVVLIGQAPREILKLPRESPATVMFLVTLALMAWGLFAAGLRLLAQQ